jgi:hypothetical protein
MKGMIGIRRSVSEVSAQNGLSRFPTGKER